MVFCVTVVTFLMTLLMNKFTSNVMDDWSLDAKSLKESDSKGNILNL